MGVESSSREKDTIDLSKGDVVVINTPGGWGYGKPEESSKACFGGFEG